MAYWAQKTALMWQIALVLTVSSLSFSCKEEVKTEPLPYYNTPNFTPIFINNKADVDQKITHYIADFSFKDQNNKTITQKDMRAKFTLPISFLQVVQAFAQ